MIELVTFERITACMQEFGITLSETDNPAIYQANLNGYPVSFAIIDNGVLIIRADKHTDEDVADGNPASFLACNYYNVNSFDAKATIVDRTEKIIIRTEREIVIGAGFDDAQLKAALHHGVDYVLLAQDAVAELAEHLRKGEVPSEDTLAGEDKPSA